MAEQHTARTISVRRHSCGGRARPPAAPSNILPALAVT